MNNRTQYVPHCTAPVSPPVSAFQIASRIAPPPRVVNTRDGIVVTYCPPKAR